VNDSSALVERLKGVFVTTVTPFDSNSRIDYDRIAANTEFLVDAGIRVLVPCGNTGEFTSLSLDEAERVTAATVDAARGRAAVIAGVGWSLPMAIELASHAADSGADGVMTHHPVHTYIDREGLRRYYDELIDALDIGLVLYKRGPELTDQLIAELVASDTVIGVKYAVNDLNAFANLVHDSGAHVAWLCGTAERWAPFFHLAGAAGFSSGLANFAPHESLALFDALSVGEWDRAMEIRARLTPFEEIRQGRFQGNNVPAVKEVMRMLGLCEPYVREPLLEPDQATASLARKAVAGWSLHPAALEA
jgi:4-hydroxy-tetrahydrodipicolinate synthase